MDDAAIEERLAAFVAGELDDEDRGRMQAYLDQHPQWLAVVAALAPSWSDASDAEVPGATLRRIRAAERTRLAPGTRLGPYALAHEIGRGAMGTVYAAHDPRLRRQIAIKVLSAQPGRSDAVAEARAAVQVRHPNVVEVFDTGHAAGRPFIAMELLDGVDLGTWRRQGPRTVAQVIDVFVDAGRGLAAAHAKGLVHRDFEPANVFVTRSGRVVVVDFGLAANMLNEASEGQPGVVGTDAYMAPEIRAASIGDARVDQFSFAVALAEALDGKLPAASSLAGRKSGSAPARGHVPGQVRRALRRAMATDPAQRFPHVDALLDALTRQPVRRWPFVVAVAGLGIGAWSLRGDGCERVGDAIETTWNRAAANAVHERYGSLQSIEERVGELDRYASGWKAARTRQCTAGEASSPAVRACLVRARHAMAAVVEVLTEGEPDSRALEAIGTLPDLAQCEAARTAVASLDTKTEALIARVEALRAAGRAAQALTVAQVLASRLPEVDGDPGLAARGHRAYALALRDATHYSRAQQQLVRARGLAQEASDDRLVADIYADLAWVVGYLQSRHDEGRDLIRHAQAWAQRVGDPPELAMHRHWTAGWVELDAGDPAAAVPWFQRSLDSITGDTPVAREDRAMTLNGLGAAMMVAGDIDGALRALRDAADTLAALRGDDHLSVAKVRNNIAACLRAQGKLVEAIELFVTNLAVFERAQGPASVTAAQTRINLAVAHLDLGEFDRVLRYADDALAAFDSVLDPEHPLVAKAHTLRGDARMQLGDHEGALVDLNFALEHEIQSLGLEHPSVGTALTDLGSTYYELERPTEAIEHHRRALAVLEAAWGADHADLSIVHVNLGLAHVMAQDFASAKKALRRGVAIAGPVHIAAARTQLGRVLLHEGDTAAAIASLEQALVDHAAVESDPVHLAQTKVALARAVASSSPTRARSLVASALPVLDDAGATETAAEARSLLAQLDSQ